MAATAVAVAAMVEPDHRSPDRERDVAAAARDSAATHQSPGSRRREKLWGLSSAFEHVPERATPGTLARIVGCAHGEQPMARVVVEPPTTQFGLAVPHEGVRRGSDREYGESLSEQHSHVVGVRWCLGSMVEPPTAAIDVEDVMIAICALAHLRMVKLATGRPRDLVDLEDLDAGWPGRIEPDGMDAGWPWGPQGPHATKLVPLRQ
jgi:hypothetical protein